MGVNLNDLLALGFHDNVASVARSKSSEFRLLRCGRLLCWVSPHGETSGWHVYDASDHSVFNLPDCLWPRTTEDVCWYVNRLSASSDVLAGSND